MILVSRLIQQDCIKLTFENGIIRLKRLNFVALYTDCSLNGQAERIVSMTSVIKTTLYIVYYP